MNSQQNNIFKREVGEELYPFWKKIIATTDSSLKIHPMQMNSPHYDYLPQPSQSFLEEYVKAYNEGKQIKEVMVEYGDYSWTGHLAEPSSENVNVLKTNSKDNTITIKQVKESWSREEVEDLLMKYKDSFVLEAFVNHLDEEEYEILSRLDDQEWIKENL